jgi:hypothetical protein
LAGAAAVLAGALASVFAGAVPLSAGAVEDVCAKLIAPSTTTANTTTSSFFINLSPFPSFSIFSSQQN